MARIKIKKVDNDRRKQLEKKLGRSVTGEEFVPFRYRKSNPGDGARVEHHYSKRCLRLLQKERITEQEFMSCQTICEEDYQTLHACGYYRIYGPGAPKRERDARGYSRIVGSRGTKRGAHDEEGNKEDTKRAREQ